MQMPPDLPPMPAAPIPAAPLGAGPTSPAPQAQPASSARAGVLTRRLRQMVAFLAAGGFVLVLLIALGEVTLRPELRPTTILATIEAQVERGIFNQKMGHKPGELVLTEADYQKALANAQREGQAKADLAFQRELAVVQADKERVVGAYQTLYQRTNLIAQSALQMESIAQQFRQQLIAMSNGGRSMVITLKDVICGFGSQEACDSARAARREMVEEAGELSEGDMGRKVRELMAGIDDPATFITREDQKRHGMPKLPR
jgi:hypothetical protein